EIGAAQLLDEDGVGLGQQFGVFGFDLAEDAHAKARARERVAVDHLARQSEFDADTAHLVLEQLAQRLDQAQLHEVRQAADVMVALDDVRLAGLAAGRFDHVGIDRALRQPLHVVEPGGLLVEDFDEQVADDLALGFRVLDAGQRREIALGSVDADHLDAHAALISSGSHGRHHLVAFLPAQQAGIDEHAGQPVTDGLVQQGCDHGGIDAAGQAQQHLVIADLFAHAGDLVLDDVGSGPGKIAAADVGNEAPQHRPALFGVRHFGMELHAVDVARLVGHRHDRHAAGARGDAETRRNLTDAVAVAHPDIEPRWRTGVILEAIQQRAGGNHLGFGMAELALKIRFGATTQLRCQRLHAVADAENRYAEVEGFLWGFRRIGCRRRLRTARENDALWRVSRDFRGIVIPGPYLAIDADLADAPGDQLRVLRAEVEDQDLVAMDVHRVPLRESRRPRRLWVARCAG